MERRGLVERVVSDDEIRTALASPPPDTRANLRKYLIDLFESLGIKFTMKWDQVYFDSGRLPGFGSQPTTITIIDLKDPFAHSVEFFKNGSDKTKILLLEALKDRGFRQ